MATPTPLHSSRLHFTRRALARGIAALAALLFPAQSWAQQTLYWDGNGAVSGAGNAPAGNWGAAPFWSTDSTGVVATANTLTTLLDSLTFSAGNDATGSYSIFSTGSQSAKTLVIEEGTVNFAGGLVALGGGGGITLASTAGNATISSELQIAGAQTFSVPAGKVLALDGTSGAPLYRRLGSVLNVATTNTLSSTMPIINQDTNSFVPPSTNDKGIVGTWASIGTSTTARYATFDGTSFFTPLTTANGAFGAPVTAALTDGSGTANYELTNATGTVPGGFSGNTIRNSTSGAAVTTLGTGFSVNGLMNASALTWALQSNPITIGADRELVVSNFGSGMTLSQIQDNLAGPSAVTLARGSVTLGGTNTYTGPTMIGASSALVLGVGATGSLSLLSQIVDNGTLSFARTGAAMTQGGDFAGIGGVGSIAVQSGSSVVLTGFNFFTGATAVNSGKVTIDSLKNVNGGPSGLGNPSSATTGRISLGSSGSAGSLVYTGLGDTTDRGIALGGTTGSATLDQSGAGLLKFTTAFTAPGLGNKTLFLQGSMAGEGEIAGAIPDSASGSTGVTKTGTGTWTLSGASAFTGATTVSAGTLAITSIGNAGTATGNALGKASGANAIIQLATTGTLQYTGSTLGSSDRVLNLATATGGTFTLDASGSVPFALSGGVTSAGTSLTSTLALTGNGSGSESGIIANGTGSNVTAVSKTGVGAWTLSNVVNSYSGVTSVNGGTLEVTKLANGGTSSSIGLHGSSAATGSAATGLTLSGGTLKYTGTGDSTNHLFTFDANGATIAASASANGALSFTGTGPLVASGTGNRTLTLAGASTGLNALASVIANPTSGTTGLTKTDAGRWRLTGANTYSGNTSVSGGKLELSGSGSLANSPDLAIAFGATLDVSGVTGGANFDGTHFTVLNGQKLHGMGTVLGALDIGAGGTIAPGNSVGTLAVAGLSLTSATSHFALEIDLGLGLTPAADLLNVTGGISLSGSTLDVSLLNLSTMNLPETFIFATNDLSDQVIGLFGTITGLPAGYGATVLYNFGGTDALGLIGDGNDLAIRIVPEPGTAFFGLALAGALGLRRRRGRICGK